MFGTFLLSIYCDGRVFVFVSFMIIFFKSKALKKITYHVMVGDTPLKYKIFAYMQTSGDISNNLITHVKLQLLV